MRRSAPPASDHRLWLDLTDADGPFLSVPELRRVAPQGFTTLDAPRAAALKAAKVAFETAWDARADRPDAFVAAQDAWVDHVLTRTFAWGDFKQSAPVSARVTSPDGQVVVDASFAYVAGGTTHALVLVVPPTESLREAPGDGWSADQVDRLAALLLSTKVPIGVVTDGRWWGLVRAVPGTTAASGVIDSQTWIEETGPRDAFAGLLSPRHLSQGDPDQLLEVMFARSVTAAEDVTEALGAQVRRAIELLVASLSDTSIAARERGQDDPLPEPDEVYDAAVTVMMRVVFLLFAQERGLLPTGPLFEQSYGLVGQVDALRDRAEVDTPEALESTAHLWYRLLATSKALYEGATFENMRLPAYGGSLFAPDRFAFLTATRPDGGLVCPVNDRVMLAVLEAVQFANVPGQGERQISFRDIDVEQIGYIYEGLLGYTCRRASETMVGLIGKAGCEPEIPLSVLNDLADAARNDADLARRIIAWVKVDQPSAEPRSASALAKALGVSDDQIEDAEVALRSVTHDPGLAENLRTFLGAIRRDLRNRPMVVHEGGLLVAETPSRKNAGAHYTPRSLAEEVVQYALEPLVYYPGPYQTDDHTAWRLRSSSEIIGLKVADIACGSGAFLVAAARFLGARLTEAWNAEGVPGEPARLERRAIREVVASCLYGADINPMAIEMCKLSLWLVSLDAKLPFSFVDDKVLVGNSLLGLTDVAQLQALHIDPLRAGGHQDLLTMAGSVTSVDIGSRLARAAQLRRDLAHPVNDDDPMQSTRRKRALTGQLDAALADLRTMSDAVVAAGLIHGGKPGKALDSAYTALRTIATDAFPAAGEPDRTNLDQVLKRGLTPSVDTDYERWQPIHWPVELADVFAEQSGRSGGFDAVIGNPPFLGGKKVSGAVGTDVRDWFVHVLADGRRGNADLVAYFFLRAASLLRGSGTLGLIATNTIAQGDTREVGLDGMSADGFTITRSIQSRSWPAATANLEFAAVWGANGRVSDAIARVADDEPVRRITTLLEPAGRAPGHPTRLGENAGIAFIGCFVLGMGFVVEEDQARAWIAADPRNAEVLFPYLNGDDLNSRPDASGSRWVIDFNDRSEEVARAFDLPFGRVVAEVKPDRRRRRPDGTFALRRPLPDRWWQYADKRPALRRAIGDLDEVLAIALVSKTVMPLRVPTRQVFSHMLGVFADPSFNTQSVLSSSLHQLWVVAYGSTLETRVRYTPSDVFETFPRPELSEALDSIGRVLDMERREIMLRRPLGLTKLYNLVNDPELPEGLDADVDRMRQIHVELDEAVMAAYGWSDVELGHGFHTYRQMTRWTVCPAARVEILDRLLEENHRRAALQGELAPAASDDDELEGEE